MTTNGSLWRRFLDEERGQDLIEYGLLTGIVTVSSLLLLETIRTNMATLYTEWHDAAQSRWIPPPPPAPPTP